MEVATSLSCSKVTPFTSTFSPNGYALPLRHFHKQFKCKSFSLRSSPNFGNFNCIQSPLSCKNRSLIFERKAGALGFQPEFLPSLSAGNGNSRLIRPNRQFKLCCSSSVASDGSFWQTRILNFLKSILDYLKSILDYLKSLSFESLKLAISQLTPLDVCKGCLVLSVVIYVFKWMKWSVGMLVNPFFWTYFSWTWLFWPWMVAFGMAGYGIYCLNKHIRGQANLFEQIAVVTSAFTWLTLVPPAHFNGFLEGWPVVFFFVYHYFYFLNVSVRKRMYGDIFPKEHDPKWDVRLPNWQKLLFCSGVMVGHWLAAFEGPELHLIPGGWSSVGVWVLIMLTIFMQYHSTLYLAKYSEKVVVPTAVVQFGPYRFVRHPLYASTMLLFVTYFTALRAPMSSVFTIAVCLLYYGRKAELEEALMLETFKEQYSEYMSRVKCKLIPFVY